MRGVVSQRLLGGVLGRGVLVEVVWWGGGRSPASGQRTGAAPRRSLRAGRPPRPPPRAQGHSEPIRGALASVVVGALEPGRCPRPSELDGAPGTCTRWIGSTRGLHALPSDADVGAEEERQHRDDADQDSHPLHASTIVGHTDMTVSSPVPADHSEFFTARHRLVATFRPSVRMTRVWKQRIRRPAGWVTPWTGRSRTTSTPCSTDMRPE
jgi:hypothetical protein